MPREIALTDTVLIERVRLRNYKSIAACDIELGPLTFLVGQNGAGKSNFLDALRLVSDALESSLDHALRERGGLNEVRRRSSGHPTHFGIRVDLRSRQTSGHYAFSLGAKTNGAYEIQDEECLVRPSGGKLAYFKVESGVVQRTSARVVPPAASDRLFLVNAAGLPEFRPVYEALSQMRFYNLNPDRIRDLQDPDPGERLLRDGRNLASVLRQIESGNETVKAQIEEYLSRVVPGTEGVDAKSVGPKETLEFRQEVAGAKHPWRFFAASMSDGTLRVLGILVALSQSRNGARTRASLVGIEEPEIALHPAAAGILLDCFLDAAEKVQVLVTSHSPDLLDDSKIEADSLRAVVLEKGETKIGPLDEAGRASLHAHLYTAGELLRLNQLSPDPASVPSQKQLSLFSGPPPE